MKEKGRILIILSIILLLNGADSIKTWDNFRFLPSEENANTN